jgi:hypothetical protein
MHTLSSSKMVKSKQGTIADGRFYKEQDINELLTCPACRARFEDPVILPCGDSICLNCEILIREESNYYQHYRCPVCKMTHKNLIMSQLPRNKLIENLLKLKAGEVHRNKSVKDLLMNLKELQLKIDLFNLSNQLHPLEELKSNCDLVKNQISLQSDKAKNRIEYLCKELQRKVDAFEKSYTDDIEIFIKDKDLMKNQMVIELREHENTIQEVKHFIENQVNELKEFQIDEERIRESLTKSESLLAQIENDFKSLNLANVKMSSIEFLPNQTPLETGCLGIIRTV